MNIPIVKSLFEPVATPLILQQKKSIQIMTIQFFIFIKLPSYIISIDTSTNAAK